MKPKYITLLFALVMAAVGAVADAASRLSLRDVHAEGGKEVLLPVYLDNDEEITALQFDLLIPQNCYIATDRSVPSLRLENHTVQCAGMGNGRYRVIVSSGQNALVAGNSGQLLGLQLAVSDGLTEGESYPLQLENVVIASRKGDAVESAAISADLVISTSPDIEPFGVDASGVLTPGGMLSLSWGVRNVGGLPLLEGWREDIVLTDETGVRCFVGSSTYSGGLDAGSSVSRSIDIRIPDIPGIDGDVAASVRLVPFAGSGERPEREGNNSAASPQTLRMEKTLTLSGASVVPEDNNASVGYTLTRSGAASAPQTFRIEWNGDDRLSVPRSVTIPAGAFSTSFAVAVNDNKVLDDDLPGTLAASGNGYPETSVTVTVTDDELPMLSFEGEPDSVTEGDSFRITVRRERAYPVPVTLDMACDRPLRFDFPARLTIPAGEDAAEFTVKTVNNTDVELRELASFSASAPGYLSGSVSLYIDDDDLPEIELALSPSTVSEAAGGSAVVARVSRRGGSDSKVTVRISDDSDGTLYYPGEIVLDKGVESASFNIGVMDNEVVDGNREFTLTAAVYSSKCNCSAAGGSRGFVTRTLAVTDNDGPSLSLRAPSSALLEGSEGNLFTLSRNTSVVSALAVTLKTDSPARIHLPASVTLPAGESSVTFAVDVVGNDTDSDSAIVSVTAEASGFSAGSCWVNVTDTSLPDATVAEIRSDKVAALPGEPVDFTVVVTNGGNRPLPEKTPVTLHAADGESFVAYTSSILNPAQSEPVVKTVTMPLAVGQHTYYAVVNEDKKVSELSYLNNSSSRVSVEVKSDITATLVSDRSAYLPGETVKLSGKASGAVAAGREVEIYVICGGLRQTIVAQMDADGNFSGEWTPMARQTGSVAAGACYPGQNSREALASFNVMGLQYEKTIETCRLTAGETSTGHIRVTNPCDVSISGLTVSGDIPEEVRLSLPSELAPGASATLDYEIAGAQPTPGDDWVTTRFEISGQGISPQAFVLYHYVLSTRGKLAVPEQSLSTTMTKGKTRLLPVTLTNNGAGASGKITVSVSDCAWLGLASPASVGSLQPGESADIMLSLTPTDDMQLNAAVTGGVAVNAENADGVAVTLRVVPVSEETGTFTFDVCDEYTYLTSEAPHLAGAEVTVMDYATRSVVASGLSDADGLYTVTLPEGYYYATVTEPRHDSWQGAVCVDPGTRKTERVNLGIQGITVDIRYEPTEVEDEYEIVTDVKYETNVPVPVVETILPDFLDLEALAPGESLLFNAVMTNRGLITAFDTQLLVPTPPEGFSFSYPDVDVFDLPAGTARTLPVIVTRDGGAPQAAPSKAQRSGGSKCTIQTITYYDSYCGPDKKRHYIPRELKFKVCTSENIGGGGPGGSGVGLPHIKLFPHGAPSSPGGLTPPYTVKTPDSGLGQKIADKLEQFLCDPCVQGFLDAVAGCNDYDPKHPWQHFFKDIPFSGCFFGLWNHFRDKDDDHSLGDALFSCAMDVCKKAGGALVAAHPVIGGGLIATCEFLEEGKGAADCGKGLLGACPALKDKFKGGSGRKGAPALSGYPSYIEQWQEKMGTYYESMESAVLLGRELLGDPAFFSSDQDQIGELFTGIGQTPAGELLDVEALRSYKPDNITDAQFEAFVIRYNNTVRVRRGETVDGPHMDVDRIRTLLDGVGACGRYALEHGYSGPEEMIEDAYAQLDEGVNGERNSICSSVTLSISQRMTMTRQAVRATLDVTNGHGSETMTDFRISFNVYDALGRIAGSDKMQVAFESIDGFEGDHSLDAGWSLGAKTDGRATVLFIPTRYAAPDEEQDYTFTGCISYVDPFTGLTVTRELAPATLAVYPSPVIDMTYLMQRDVFGDDPLTTDVVEKSVPSEFALIMTNKGKGDAENLRMTTSQPVITDNEKGLDVRFEIVSSQVGGSPAALAFGKQTANDFGTLGAGATTYAQWWIRSSLLGHYDDYNVTATHLSSYGNEALSLLDVVEIKELIHGFALPGAFCTDGQNSGDGAVRAFLTNEVKDLNDTPDFLRFSDGRDGAEVGAASAEIYKVDENTYSLHIDALKSGWVYGSVSDPMLGRGEIREVRTANGDVLSSDICWLTDRTMRDRKEPLYENRLHFVANAGYSTDYLITYEPRPVLELEVIGAEGLPADGTVATTPQERVRIMFNKEVAESSFTSGALSLTCQAQPVDMSGASLQRLSPTEYEIGFSGLASADGYYTLTVQTADIKDTEGFFGASGKPLSWIQLAGGRYALSVKSMPAGAGVASLSSASVAPGEKIVLKAEPAAGYAFDGWKLSDEYVSYDAETEWMPTCASEFTAIFKPVSHTVTIDFDSTAGSVSGAGTGMYDHGTQLDLRAEPAAGYAFAGWTVDGKPAGDAVSLTLPVNEDMTVSALFSQLPGSGSVSVTYGFDAGWNWASFGMFGDREARELMSPVRVNFRELRAGDNTVSFDGSDWDGSVSIDRLAGYKLRFENVTSLRAEGAAPDEGSLTVTLHPGVNRIAYPLTEARSLTEALKNVSAEEGDAVRGHDSFAVFNGTDWVGTLAEMLPGHMYEVSVGKLMSFSWPAVEAQDLDVMLRTAAPAAPSAAWAVRPADYPDVMGIVASLRINDADMSGGEYVIGAFDEDGTCRGLSSVVDGLYFMTVYSDDAADKLRFRVYDVAAGASYEAENTAVPVSDMLGSVAAPYMIDVRDAGVGVGNLYDNEVSVYPNPATDVLYISGVHDPDAVITLVNTNGLRCLKMRGLPENGAVDVTALDTGMYLLTVDTVDGSLRRKVIIDHR